MSLTLPYPTYTAFTETTVHSHTVHNEPHQGLLSNDVAIKNYLDGTIDPAITSLASKALHMNTPVEIYRMANGAYSPGIITIPPEYATTGAINVSQNRTWVNGISYPSFVSTPADSIIIRSVAYAQNGSAYIRIRSTGTPEITTAFAWSVNTGDGSSDTSTIEIPYSTSRTIDVYPSGVSYSSYYVIFVFIVGYRA